MDQDTKPDIPAKSWQPEQKVDGRWYPNALRFATYAEAIANAQAKHMAWTMSEGYRATGTQDPVNYTYDLTTGELRSIPPDDPHACPAADETE